MKKYIYIGVFCFCFCGRAQAQTYLALPDSNASWIVEYLDGWFASFSEVLYSLPYNKQDTIINSRTYTKFPNQGAYRNDSLGRTYFIPQDSIHEYILQDLTKNTGDSVYNVICSNDYYLFNFRSYNFYVDSTNHITIGPYTLKRMYLTNGGIRQNCAGWEELVWIEKVGCLTGGFFNVEPCYLGGPGGTWLGCMSSNDTTYYYSYWAEPEPSVFYTYGSCNTIFGVNEIKKDNTISISPNPTPSQTTISFSSEQKNSTINITNTLGQLVYTTTAKETKQINITLNQPAGIYFVTVIAGDSAGSPKVRQVMKLIKE